MKLHHGLAAALLGLVFATRVNAAAPADSIDAGIPEYAKASGISGSLSSIGSDTLANLMTLWGEEFKRLYPNVTIQIQAAGSSTAPPRCRKVPPRSAR